MITFELQTIAFELKRNIPQAIDLHSVEDCDKVSEMIEPEKANAWVLYVDYRQELEKNLPPGIPPGPELIAKFNAAQDVMLRYRLGLDLLYHYVGAVRGEFVYAKHDTNHVILKVNPPRPEMEAWFKVTFSLPVPPSVPALIIGVGPMKAGGYDYYNAYNAAGQCDLNPAGTEATGPKGEKLVKQLSPFPFAPGGYWHCWRIVP